MSRTCNLCIQHGETRKHYGLGMCEAHHGRWRRGTRGKELTRSIRNSPTEYQNPRVSKASRNPETKDLYWAAGFLEGDGCFSKNRVNAGQVQKEPLLRLQEIFGGTISTANKKRPNEQDGWQWSVTGPRARGVMMTLYTIMSPRRRNQIRNVLDWAEEGV